MKISEIPSQMDWKTLRKILVEMRSGIHSVAAVTDPPRPVKNLTATAMAGSILIMFTRTDGDNYVLYWNTTPSLNGSTRIELGNRGEYTDNIGDAGIKRYYFVRAKKRNGMESSIVGPVFATSLALNITITPPTRPPAVDEFVRSDEVGYPVEQ